MNGFVTLTKADFEKLIKILSKEQQDGANIQFKINSTVLAVKTMDRLNREITIELHDKDYPMMPTITRTESF